MFEYMTGRVVEITPTFVILEVGNIGYCIHISLQSYTVIQKTTAENVKIYLHEHIREDAQLLYGFSHKEERELFRLLITVSGIGANTARLMLSSAGSEELTTAIASGNITFLKNIKGIGQKSAERIVVELRDKIKKTGVSDQGLSLTSVSFEEALYALLALGYSKPAIEKLFSKHRSELVNFSVEEIIKYALQRL